MRYLLAADHQPARVWKVDRMLEGELDIKDIKFPIKIRDIHKIEKKNYSIGISILGYENKKSIHLMWQKNTFKKYVLIKDFKTLMYDHTLHCGRKQFCSYCLQAVSTEEILKCHNNDWFKTNNTQRINMPKKVNMTHLKISKGKQNCHLWSMQTLKVC